MNKLTTFSEHPTPPAGIIARPPAVVSKATTPRSPLPLGNNTESASNAQSERKRTFNPWDLQKKAKRLAPWEDRCQICQQVRVDYTETPGVVSIEETKDRRHYFGNLYSCGNVWTCPVCAHRTARRRGEEVKRAMETHRTFGGRTYMLTLTLQHRRYSSLPFILQALRSAARRLKSGRWFQQYRAGIIGTISGLETTWSDRNGWHPHLHMILFTSHELTPEQIEDWKSQWRHVVEKEKLFAGTAGADLRECFPSDYNAKFGADFEITGDVGKSGAGLSQWQMLDRSHEELYAALWLEYAAAFKGRRRLTWSKGLKGMFGLQDVDDQEEETQTVATIDADDYRLIVKNGWEREFLLSVDEIGFRRTYLWFFETVDHNRRWRLDRAGGT